MVQERLSIDAGPHAVNKLALDRSGTVLAVASEDHSGVHTALVSRHRFSQRLATCHIALTTGLSFVSQ
jgi:hypothetical protein